MTIDQMKPAINTVAIQKFRFIRNDNNIVGNNLLQVDKHK